MKRLLFILALITFFSFDILSQSIPRQINYQGLLKDAAGNNVSDGTYTMVFGIYNESTGGTSLWSETQSVTVSGGLFFVRLGSVTPITTVPFDRQHYLGIKVNSGDELSPRTYLSPSPYSFMSMNVIDNSITTSKIQDGAVTKAKLGSDVSFGTSGAAGGDLKGNYPDPVVQKLQGKLVSETVPAVDQVLKWDGNQWKPSADATATGTSGGDITKVTAGNGLTGGGDANDVTLNVGAGTGITVSADAVALNTTYSDSRYVNEGQANSVAANMIAPNIVSSVDGVSNDGGNIDLVAGSNITITPNNTAKTITISATDGGGTTGDNLGNHTATQNIKLNNHWLSGDGGNEGVYVSGTGNVGIGTSNPDYNLHVKGWIKEEGSDFFMVDPSRGNGGRALVHMGSNNNDDRLALNFDGDFEKGVQIDGSIVYIKGNVGIGTDNPQEKLHVVLNDMEAKLCYYSSPVNVFANYYASVRGEYGDIYGCLGRRVSTRTIPSITSYYGVYGYAPSGSTNNYAGYFSGPVEITGPLTKPSGSFKIDHPLDPANKYLYHSFVESPDMMNIYNGNVVTDGLGYATVTLPDWFEALNKDFRYQLTVIGDFAQAIIAQEVNGSQFMIRTDKPNIKVSWQVTGIRHDAYAKKNRIPVEEMKSQAEKGKYLHPEAFGLQESQGINFHNPVKDDEPKN